MSWHHKSIRQQTLIKLNRSKCADGRNKIDYFIEKFQFLRATTLSNKHVILSVNLRFYPLTRSNLRFLDVCRGSLNKKRRVAEKHFQLPLCNNFNYKIEDNGKKCFYSYAQQKSKEKCGLGLFFVKCEYRQYSYFIKIHIFRFYGVAMRDSRMSSS